MQINTDNINSKVIKAQGVLNARELGGYTGRNGRIIKTGRFIRTGDLSSITENGINTFKALGVDTVVDLRSSMETQNAPDVFAELEGFKYCHVPMLDYINSNVAAGIKEALPKSMEELYIGLLDNSQDSLLKVFKIFADTQNKCILFHCTAGKDRTGVAAMLLLGLAGTEESVITEDYSYSEHLLSPWKSDMAGHTAIPDHFLRSSPITMRRTLEHLNKTYGSAESYLSSIGLTAEEKQNILDKLFL